MYGVSMETSYGHMGFFWQSCVFYRYAGKMFALSYLECFASLDIAIY